MPIDHAEITAAVLAGGRATRMGGEDKGLIEVAGKTMIEHVLDALRTQVGQVVVNANRNLDEYRRLTHCEVIPDEVSGFAGPLAGLASVMALATTPYVLTVPCDCPLVSPSLVPRLAHALAASGAEVAVAHDGRRLQPVFALVRTALLQSLREFLEAGERKIDIWYARHQMVTADFSDNPDIFANINTAHERDALEARLRPTTC